MKVDNKRFHILDEFIGNGIEKNRNTKLTSKTQSPADLLFETVSDFLFRFFGTVSSGTYVGSSFSAFLLFCSSFCEIASRLPFPLYPQGLKTAPKSVFVRRHRHQPNMKQQHHHCFPLHWNWQTEVGPSTASIPSTYKKPLSHFQQQL